jgi:hypothetical protein
VGNLPVLRLRLKMWDKGTAIELPINLISFVETPDTSQLDLEAKPDITFLHVQE